MKQQDFEARVLELWTKTRVPLTRANLMAITKVSRSQADRWLEEMSRDGVIELDSNDSGDLVWTVRGSARPGRGPETVAEVDKLGKLSAEVDRLTSGASLALRAAGLTKQPSPAGPARGERKSLLASTLLSFFLGPIGWLYAAPLKEAIPVIVVYALVCAILPTFLLAYILGLVNAASAIAGALYAWSYNQEGHRAPLLGKATRALGSGKR